MLIKITCPNPKCKRPLRVDVQHAGKKIACAGCQQKIRLPTREELKLPATLSATPASSNGTAGEEEVIDFDAMAAAAVLHEKTAAQEANKTEMIDFVCPQCDEPIQVAVEHSGKRVPCPACRRIILVPKVDTGRAKDWREKEARLPTLAKQEAVKLEGAWGNLDIGQVSREALEEAKALPKVKQKLTPLQWLRRGILAAMILVVVLGSWWMFERYRASAGESQTLKAIETAIADAQTPAEDKGLLRRMLGEWYLLSSPDPQLRRSGMELVRQCRSGVSDPLWLWFLSREGARVCAQYVSLDPQQKDPLVDVPMLVQLLATTPEEEPRQNVYRALARGILAQTGGDSAKTDAAVNLLLLVVKQALPGKPWSPQAPPVGNTAQPRAALDYSEQLNCAGILAQELILAGAQPAALKLIDREKSQFQPGMPIPKQWVAALTAAGAPALEIGKSSAADAELGQALGHLLARRHAEASAVLTRRLEAGFAEDLLLPVLDAAQLELDAGRSSDALQWLQAANQIAEIYVERRPEPWKQRIYAHLLLVEMTARAGDVALAEQRISRLKMENATILNQLARGIVAGERNPQGQTGESLLSGTVPGSGQIWAAFALARKHAAADHTSNLDWVDTLPANSIQTAARLGALLGEKFPGTPTVR